MILLWCHRFWHHDSITCSISYCAVWCHLIITKPTQYYCIVFMTSYKVSLLLSYYDFTGFCWDVTRELHCFVASYEALCLFHHRRYCDDAAFVFFKSLCHITLLWCNSLWWDCNGIALPMTSYGFFCCIVTMTLQDFFHRCHNWIASFLLSNSLCHNVMVLRDAVWMYHHNKLCVACPLNLLEWVELQHCYNAQNSSIYYSTSLTWQHTRTLSHHKHNRTQ